ncbi:MAG TPA: transglycosylase SLT domain-containing protein [Acidobacteriaceae bacterium]
MQSATAPKKQTTIHHTAQSQSRSRKTASHIRSRRRGPAAHVRHARTRRSRRTAKSIARSRRLQRAFVASSQLRPMAQQLAQNRTPAAYSGVAHYADTHKGDAAAAAYLALGHAYLLDRRFPDAIAALGHADAAGDALDDYAAYLTAQAEMQSNQLPQAETVLDGFAAKYPDSVFVPQMPVLLANLALAQGDPQTALHVLSEHAAEPTAIKPDYILALARAQQIAGDTGAAARSFRRVYLGFPLTPEAAQAKTQLQTMGANAALTVAEREHHANALYAAGRYNEAYDDYRALAADPGVQDAEQHDRLLVAAAACDYKLKRAYRQQIAGLPDTNGEAGARRLYLLTELARDRGDVNEQQADVTQMEQRFPQSPWLAEALYSSGNMYLLRKDYPSAAAYYTELVERFPKICKGAADGGPCSDYAPSAHWRAAWLDYRLEKYSDAARLFDEQIAHYPGGKEIPSAIYWRARIYQDQEHQPAKAAAYYLVVKDTYLHYYYAQQAAERLAELGAVTPAEAPELDSIQPPTIPALTDDVPEDDPHVVRAKLLANAGLNEYIAPEIQAAEGSDEWGAFAEAEIYHSYGEDAKAMRVMKRALPFYTSAPIASIPLAYWKILFPEPYWGTIESESAKNGLDPFMVASLIRQESEFNPTVVSYANAWGLMQLLPSVGAEMAHKDGVRHFDHNELLDPVVNIKLGTKYLRQTLDKFEDKAEYAFAAYNAGDDRVADWKAGAPFHGMDEFVESIPFTETREYVQGIVRNEMIYRDLAAHRTAAKDSSTATKASTGDGAKGMQ